jgi:uncharacterized membrane protein
MSDRSRRPSATLTLVVVLLTAACGDTSSRSPDSTVATPTDSTIASMTAEPLRALGTEPFWALDVDSSGLRYITPDDTSGIRFPPVAPIAAGDTMVWTGVTERAAIHVRIWREQCSDGMSDRIYTYAARVRVDTTEYKGCADRLRVIIPASKNH